MGRCRPRACLSPARPRYLRCRRGALQGADVQAADLHAVAVTQGPGLVGSLLVGVAFAKAFAWSLNRPVIPVHHLAGHIESLVLAHGELPLPAAILVVSGGHTSLYFVAEPGAYQLIGRTRDDAAGEAYDKVAKLLGAWLSRRSGHRQALSRRKRGRPRFSDRAADACGSQCAAADRSGGASAAGDRRGGSTSASAVSRQPCSGWCAKVPGRRRRARPRRPIRWGRH